MNEMMSSREVMPTATAELFAKISSGAQRVFLSAMAAGTMSGCGANVLTPQTFGASEKVAVFTAAPDSPQASKVSLVGGGQVQKQQELPKSMPDADEEVDPGETFNEKGEWNDHGLVTSWVVTENDRGERLADFSATFEDGSASHRHMAIMSQFLHTSGENISLPRTPESQVSVDDYEWTKNTQGHYDTKFNHTDTIDSAGVVFQLDKTAAGIKVVFTDADVLKKMASGGLSGSFMEPQIDENGDVFAFQLAQGQELGSLATAALDQTSSSASEFFFDPKTGHVTRIPGRGEAGEQSGSKSPSTSPLVNPR